MILEGASKVMLRRWRLLSYVVGLLIVCFGVLGVGVVNADPAPVGSRAMVSGGAFHTLALKDDGTVWAWGQNSSGQLGDGTTQQSSFPVQVLTQPLVPLTDIVAVSAGPWHSVAIKSDGTVWQWDSFSSFAVQVDSTNLTDVKAIAAGNGFSIALKEDGSVWSWGLSNYVGQLGNGTTDSSQNTAVQVKGENGEGFLTDVKGIAAGDSHSLALKNDGTVWAWGGNSNKQLGDGSFVDKWTPVQSTIVDLPVKEVAASGVFSSVLSTNGDVYSFNQWSLEYLTNIYMSDSISLAMSNSMTMGLNKNGTVWTSGVNADGILGTGDTSYQRMGAQVVDSSNESGYLERIVSIGTGASSAFAIKEDGTLWSWGSNNWGQLGTNLVGSSNRPVQVIQSNGEPFQLFDDLTLESLNIGTYSYKTDYSSDIVTVEVFVPYGVSSVSWAPELLNTEMQMIVNGVGYTGDTPLTFNVSRGAPLLVGIQINNLDLTEMREYQYIIYENPLNTISLNYLIENAQTLHDNAIEALEPWSYKIGSKAVLLSAIELARDIIGNRATTQAEVDSMYYLLDSKVQQFQNQRYFPGNKYYLEELESQATALLVSAVEGTKPGQYASGSKATLQTAIDQIQFVLLDNTPTDVEVEEAESLIKDSIYQFVESRIPAPIIYSQDFNQGDGGFTSGGDNSSWAWGTPLDLNEDPVRSNMWGTNLDGLYNDNEDSYIVSPNIDLSGILANSLELSFWGWHRLESCCDRAKAEVSKDGGLNWTEVYVSNNNNQEGQNNGSWKKVTVPIDSSYAVENFKVRFKLSSDFSVVDNGFYVDDVSVGYYPAVLEEEIAIANTIYNEAEEGWNPGRYPYGSKAILLAAIQEASQAPSTESDNAIRSLRQSVKTFKEKMFPQRLEQLSIGSIVEFAGQRWILIDPVSRKLILKEVLPERQFSPDEGDFIYDPEKPGTAAYYLNEEFLDSFGSSADFIEEHNWNVRNEVGEIPYGSGNVPAKVGLLTVNEYKPLSAYYDGLGIFISYNSESFNTPEWWLITPEAFGEDGEGGLVGFVRSGGEGEGWEGPGGAVGYNHPQFEYYLRPVIHLKNNVFATGDGSAASPFVITTGPSDFEKVSITLDGLNEQRFLNGNVDMQHIVGDLNLPYFGAYNTTITWNSDNLTIDANGFVQRPLYFEQDAMVHLTATVTSNTYSVNKSFELKVLRIEATDEQAVEDTLSYLTDDLLKLENADLSHVTSALNLPVNGLLGSTIGWESSNEAINTVTGEVYRPAFSMADVEVTITATVTHGTYSQQKSFTVTVLHEEVPDEQAVVATLIGLTEDELVYGNVDLQHVASALKLPTSGVHDTLIEWTSDNEAINASTGAVSRPAYNLANAEVTLTANVSRGAYSLQKQFTVIVLHEEATDEQAVEDTLSVLTGDVVKFENAALSQVTSALNLPTRGEYGVTITWISDNAAIDAATGAVTRPAYNQDDTKVTLTATVTRDTYSREKTFEVTVLHKEATNEQAVAETLNTLTEDLIKQNNVSLGQVTTALNLPTSGEYGATVTWTSDNVAVNKATGAVTRPAYNQSNVEVTLTATVTRATYSQQKSFIVTVLHEVVTNEIAVAEVLSTLTDDVVKYNNVDLGQVTIALNLPTSGDYNTTITWASDNEEIVSKLGAVTRPAYNQANARVTLTATVSRGTHSQQKQFTVTVLHEAATNEQAVAETLETITEQSLKLSNPDLQNVTSSLNLSLTGTNGVTITWWASNNSVINTSTGAVTRPSYDEGDAWVALTATVTSGTYSQIKPFNIKVLKLDSVPANVLSLSIYDGATNLLPAFTPNTYTYTATVSQSVYSVELNMVLPELVSASIQLNGVPFLSGVTNAVYGPIPLTMGMNTVTISTYGQHLTPQTYHIAINKLGPANAEIQGIYYGGHKLEFDPTTNAFRLIVNNLTTSLQLNAIPSDPYARLSVTGATYTNWSISIPTLNTGITYFTIKVTSQDGTLTKDYPVAVYRMLAELISDIDGTGKINIKDITSLLKYRASEISKSEIQSMLSQIQAISTTIPPLR